MIVVASPGLAARIGPVEDRDAILALPLLHEDSEREWRSWLAQNGIDAPSPLPGTRCWHAHLALAAARQGRGVALANRFLIRDDLARNALVELPLPQTRPLALGAYVLVAREDRWTVPVLAKLRQFLRTRAS